MKSRRLCVHLVSRHDTGRPCILIAGMLRLAALLLISVLACAQDRWAEYRYGPFHVVTNAGERDGRRVLAQLTQFRHALGRVMGKTDLVPTWPIRIVLFKSEQQAASNPGGLSLGRDAYTGSLATRDRLPRPLLHDCAQVLIEGSVGRLPAEVERGIEELFATLDTDGARITLGEPPPEAERTRDWARMHMLTVPDESYGKLRVLIHNLDAGVEAEPAFTNAFGKTPPQIEKEVDAYIRAAVYPRTSVNSAALNPLRDFATQPIDASLADVFIADLCLGQAELAGRARDAYLAIRKRQPESVEAAAGLGLAELLLRNSDEARSALAFAAEHNTVSARALCEYARLETGNVKALPALEKAAKLNPRWSEPYRLMAQREPDSDRRLVYLASAAKLSPRNSSDWQALAKAYQDAGRIPETASASASAKRAATNSEERARIREARAEVERKRVEFEAAEQRRREDEKRKELEDLKKKAAASIEAALEKANRGDTPQEPGRKVESWWEGPQPDAKIRGVLVRVDCLGKQFRLVIEGPGKRLTRLLIRDPSQVVIQGGGNRTLGCGPQSPPRKISVEYFAKPNARLQTAGDVAIIDFPQ